MSQNHKKQKDLTNLNNQSDFSLSRFEPSKIGLSKMTSSISNYQNNFNNPRLKPQNYTDQIYNPLSDESSSFRSMSTPPSVISLPTRLENTNRSILAVFRLCFFLAFWLIVGCIVVAFGKDVLNRLEQEREQKRFEVDLCLNDFKSKFLEFFNQ